ncbi:unnamed protein product [marine sediment metagenome]|uniref:Uncharacterized protein n=1 Tax=marine sediment metagenome TaxID=412755 RepID=X1MMT4_9ZZZZ
MCFGPFKKKTEEKPDWITQSRAEVAQDERDAAAIHYTYMQLIEDGTWPEDSIAGGYDHHEYWWIKHLEAAWYTENPEVK